MDLLNLTSSPPSNYVGALILWNSINLHIYFCLLPALKEALLANVTHYSLVELDSLVRLQHLCVQLTEYASYLWESICHKGVQQSGLVAEVVC